MRLFIGSSSNDNILTKYKDDCKELLELLLKDNDLVFGASDKGLMGLSYESAKKNNRKVTGICPKVYESSLETIECDETIITTSILDSTTKLYKNSDAIIFLPGGYGTLYELFGANFSKICNEIDIPIILYNSCGYYDKLISFIEDIHKSGFLRDKEMNNYYVANNAKEVISFLENNIN